MPLFRSFYRYVAIVLSFCLIFSLIGPNFAKAAPGEAKRAPKKQTLIADIGELPSKLPKEKLELTSKRTSFSTRYLNPDGSFTEEIFMNQQFYQDSSDKKWKKVDNKLKNSPSKLDKFENTANDVKTLFAQQSGNDELVTVEKNGKSIGLVPVAANKVPGTIKENEVTFKGMLQDTDIRYRVNGGTVKEDIVLNQYQNNNTFSFELKQKDVTANKEKNGTIVFKDSKGNPVWFFENPFMTDADGKYSEKVTLQLRQENGKTFVDVVADPEFLKDPKTKFPVTIDPTIDDWNILRDNFVASNSPDSIYSSNTYLDTGYNSTFGTTRALARFYLPSLPSNSSITSATFNAYQTNNDGQQVSVDLYRINSDWPASVTWNSQPATSSTKESTVTSNTYNAYWSWDITTLAKDWYNGYQANYGFMLKQQNEATSPYRSFNSVNSGTNTPRLTINYRVEPIGAESFWLTTNDGVNPANGNLFYQETDIDIPGNGPEVSLTRTFNNRKSQTKGIFGYGWFTNWERYLSDKGSGPITYVDEDSTRQIFGEKVGGGYESPVGIYLDLAKNSDGTYTITDNDGTKTNFNSNRNISSIVDTNGNKTTFIYDTSGRLTKVQDASLRETAIAYGTNGYVSSVTDPAGRVTNYEYDNSGNLIKVTDAKGKTTTFTYDTDHNLTGIIDPSNIKTTIVYDTLDRVTSVSRPITTNGVTNTSQTTYSYDTTNLVTSVTDGEGKKVDYTTNPNGNVVKITENPQDVSSKAVTQYCYNDNNDLTTVIDANLSKDSSNTCNNFKINPSLTKGYVYTYDTNGNLTGEQLPDNQKATYEYDSQNNITKETDFNQNTSTNDYDGNNNQMETTDPNIQTTAGRYDSKGNLLYDTHPMSAADNLLSNSSFELDKNSDNWPDGWTKYMQDQKTATFGWSTTKRFGIKAVSISNPTGWAIVSSKQIKYTAGDQYIASAYIKTENTAGTALIKIEYLDTQGTPIEPTSYSFGLKGTHDWTRVQAVVSDVPSGTDSIRVSVGLNAGSGTAHFDGVQLEKGTTLSAYNLVDNSSYERMDANPPSMPENWETSGNLSANDKIIQNVNQSDDNVYIGESSFQMTGETGKDKFIKQHINISGDANTKLTFSGWSKQVGANPNGGDYALQVGIHYTDGTAFDWTNANDFSKTASDWQHVAAEVNPKATFDYIDVYYYYKNQTGTAWFDAMRLELGASITSNTYDAGGNYVTSIKDPLGNAITFGYDAVGNRTSVKDAKAQTTSFAYDGRNLLTKVTDTKTGITSYGYDANGNRTSVTDAKGNVTNYGYNEFNHLSKITNPLNQITQFNYDKNGNQTKIVYPKGDSITSTYDDLNRLSATYVNSVKKWDFVYDANKNLTSVTDALGKQTTFTYDSNNRLTKESRDSFPIDYIYDSNSNPNSVKFPSGTTTVSLDYAYNKLNQLISLARNGSNRAKFVYDERGNVTSVKRANNSYASLQYDSSNRINELKNYKNTGDILDSYKYSYDPNGNQTSVVTDKGTMSYEYDALNQLTKESLTDGTTISYEYDAVGNRTKKIETKDTSSTTTTYSYSAANELTGVNSLAYTYDQNGNLTNDGDKTFVYNENNQLIEVKDQNGSSLAKFTYDYKGNRTSMTTSTGTTNFYYAGDKVIAETDASTNVIVEYSWDDQGNPVTMVKGGKTYYYHLNGHGDVTALTDENGNIVAQYQYDAWGKITSSTGTMKDINPYRYAGYRFDQQTGLYYLMARYYNSSLGRFITEDTYKGKLDDPLSMNLYAYTDNNPLIYTDSSGHCFWDACVIEGSVVYATVAGLAAVGAGIGVGQLISRSNNDPATGIIYMRRVVAGPRGTVGLKYVGKSKSPTSYSIRMAAHKSNGKKVGLTYGFARLKQNIRLSQLSWWEQHYINMHGGAKSMNGTLQNKINAISPKKWSDLGGETYVRW
ncbi:DNRLRE domain-containing protein [Neobacillus drentensis]|jgi:RHS repeat-associated protein|uniref:DNRLRE domain-containing protein n=2 Tax=Neobacillus drentensis TaxID=220684 RepID=UPI000BF6A1D8|nr:hypothetical protein CN481_16365 [Bacillus sp. AFS006103]